MNKSNLYDKIGSEMDIVAFVTYAYMFLYLTGRVKWNLHSSRRNSSNILKIYDKAAMSPIRK